MVLLIDKEENPCLSTRRLEPIQPSQRYSPPPAFCSKKSVFWICVRRVRCIALLPPGTQTSDKLSILIAQNDRIVCVEHVFETR